MTSVCSRATKLSLGYVKDKVTAFRVCVPLTQREKLFDPQRALSSVTGNLRKPILLLMAGLDNLTFATYNMHGF